MEKKIMFQGKALTIRRIVVYVVGLWVMALGIAFAVNSDFGVSPVTTLPYVCGRILGISVGTGTMVAYTAYIIIEALVYRKEFKLIYILQFPAAIMFGYFTDMCKALISPLGTPGTIITKVLFVLIGVVLLGAGLCGYLEADIMAIPPDALAVAFAWLFKKPLGNVKRIFDLCIVASSLILSLVFMHDYQGIWIGTIIAALGVGTMLNFWSKVFRSQLKVFLYGKPEEKKEEEVEAAVEAEMTAKAALAKE